MSNLWTRFRTAATFLWLLVALLLAFNIGAMFALGIRQVIFVLIAATGVVVLVSINWPMRQRPLTTVARLPAGEKVLLSAITTPTHSTQELPRKVQPAVQVGTETLFPEGSPEKFRGNEARVWLDDFLRKQQQK